MGSHTKPYTDAEALAAAEAGAASAATASKIVIRDAAARAKFAAPAAAGDVLIKGTRHLIAEMPTLTTDKIWKGVAGVPAEVSLPAAGAPSASGQYTGDSSVNRAIPHGLGVTSKIVFIFSRSSNDLFHRIMTGLAYVLFVSAAADGSHAVTAMNSTNFYVGNAANYGQSANYNGFTYFWVAIG